MPQDRDAERFDAHESQRQGVAAMGITATRNPSGGNNASVLTRELVLKRIRGKPDARKYNPVDGYREHRPL